MPYLDDVSDDVLTRLSHVLTVNLFRLGQHTISLEELRVAPPRGNTGKYLDVQVLLGLAQAGHKVKEVFFNLNLIQTCAPHDKTFSILRLYFPILQKLSVLVFFSGAIYRRKRYKNKNKKLAPPTGGRHH